MVTQKGNKINFWKKKLMSKDIHRIASEAYVNILTFYSLQAFAKRTKMLNASGGVSKSVSYYLKEEA